MRAQLRDPAAHQHRDPVRVPHRRDAMRDKDRRAVAHHLAQLSQDRLFRVGVHTGQRIVQHQNRGIPHHCARNRRALLLAAGERDASLAHRGVHPMRKLLELAADMRHLGRRQHILGRSVWRAKGDVLPDRFAEQERLLRHETNIRPQRRQRIIPHRPVVDQHHARIGVPRRRADRIDIDVIDSRNQPHHGRLARARRPHQRQARPRRYLQVDIVQHLYRLAVRIRVSEVQMPELDLALQPRLRSQRRVRRRIVNRRLFLHQLINADHRSRAALHQVHDPPQRNYRPRQHHHVGVEGDELAHCDPAC